MVTNMLALIKPDIFYSSYTYILKQGRSDNSVKADLIFTFFKTGYSKTCVKQTLSKRPQIGFQDQLSLNAGQKYCRMLQGEHSAILLTFIKLPFVIKIFILSIFEWPFYTVLLYVQIPHEKLYVII